MGHSNPVAGGQTNLVPFMFQSQGPSFVAIPSVPTTTEKGRQFAVPMLNHQNVSTLQHPISVDHNYHVMEQTQLPSGMFVVSRPEMQSAGTVAPIVPISMEGAVANRSSVNEGAPTNATATQTGLTKLQIKQNDDEMLYLRHELYKLREEKASSVLDELAFQNDEYKVKFYTGLPSLRLLMTFLEFISPHITSSNRNSLTKFQEFVMVLMRLRRNLPLQDLGYRFNVASSTASRLFERWIDTMAVRLQHLIMFPEHTVMDSRISREFATVLGDYREPIFVHCIELFLDWPRSWVKKSNRKTPESVKFLIGLSPCGLIGFVSKVWMGKDTPRYQSQLIEKSGIVELLHHNDVVLSVPEFDFSESGLYVARVIQPDVADEEKQLSVLEFSKEGTKRIAGFVRVQTESVVRALRQKYTFLDGKVNAELVKPRNGQPESLMDKVVRVCCSLTNTCAPSSPQCSTLRTKLKGNYELLGDKKNKSQDWQYKDTT
ncbi:uncharacterized protein LOC119737753 isoform X2 [Patiria miniata]|nr:uncharacterized protein LOC119737753 isoform X2 [Patiria miniata]